MKLRFISMIICFSILFTGCSRVNNDLTAEDIKESIEATDLIEGMEETGTKGLKRYYGLNANDFDSVVLYTPKSTMAVDEMLIVKVKDKSQVDALLDCIDTRVESQLKNFGGYGPEQCALVNDHEIKTKGKYVFFAISENAEQLKEAFKEAIK